MKQPSSMQSMRRRVIEEGKPTRDAQQAAAENTQALQGIDGRLSDLQASSELSGEVFEEKANGIIGAINDVQAADELTAENTEKGNKELRRLNDTAFKINSKLAQLSSMLKSKMVGAESPGVSKQAKGAESTALEAIKDSLPLEVYQPSLEELLKTLVPDLPATGSPTPFPESPVTPPVDEEKKKKEEKESKFDVKELLKTTKAGFKASVGVADKISGMLFRYTVTAAAEAAKMAGMLFSLVLGFDVIRIHFKYWSKLLETSFASFDQKAGVWGKVLEDILLTVRNVQDFWENGDYGKMIWEIVKGIFKVGNDLIEAMFLGISKLTAGVLRQFNFDGAADNVEGSAIERYADQTGTKVSDEDAEVYGRYKTKQFKEELKNTGANQAIRYGGSAEEYEKMRKEKGIPLSDTEKLGLQTKNMSDEDMAKMFAKEIQVKTDSDRLSRRTEDYKGRPERIKELEIQQKELRARIDDPSIKAAPVVQERLLKQADAVDEQLKKLTAPEPKPVPTQDSEQAKQVKQIEQNQQIINNNKEGDKSQVNVQQTNVKNNSTHMHLPTQTATLAPGVSSYQKIN